MYGNLNLFAGLSGSCRSQILQAFRQEKAAFKQDLVELLMDEGEIDAAH